MAGSDCRDGCCVAYLSRLIGLALLFPLSAWANTDCVKKWTSPGPTWQATGAVAPQCANVDPQVAVSCTLAYIDSVNSTNQYAGTLAGCSWSGSSGCKEIMINVTCVSGSTPTTACGPWSTGYALFAISSGNGIAADLSKCPTGDCTTLANQKVFGWGTNAPESYTPPTTPCLNGCAAFMTANQPWTRMGPVGHREMRVQYQMTGLACLSEVQPADMPETPTQGKQCFDGKTTDTICQYPETRPGCGFYNNKYVCTTSLGTDKCWVNSDGSRLCAAAAPIPPRPANADGTAAATPDQTIQVCTGSSCSTYTYYNTTTVSNSNSSTAGGGDPSTQGGTGTSGTGPGDGGGDGTTGTSATASGGVGCDAPPSCDGDPVGCAALIQQWRTRCDTKPSDADLLTQIGATAAEKGEAAGPHDGSVTVSEVTGGTIWGSGSCPAPISVSVMGHSLSLDIWQRGCEMAALFAPFVLGMGYLAAAMLLISGRKQ
jgi:hypothetical protein